MNNFKTILNKLNEKREVELIDTNTPGLTKWKEKLKLKYKPIIFVMDRNKKEVRAYNANAHDTYGEKEFIESHPLKIIKKTINEGFEDYFKKFMNFMKKNLPQALDIKDPTIDKLANQIIDCKTVIELQKIENVVKRYISKLDRAGVSNDIINKLYDYFGLIIDGKEKQI